MENLKKIGIFFLLFIGLMGMIASPIALGVYHSWLPMIGSLMVDGMAMPTFIKYVKRLIN